RRLLFCRHRKPRINVLTKEGNKTISGLHEALLARGKNVHRASLDAAFEDAPNMFDMKKHNDGKNVISLREGTRPESIPGKSERLKTGSNYNILIEVGRK